jgi:hypothetical protein
VKLITPRRRPLVLQLVNAAPGSEEFGEFLVSDCAVSAMRPVCHIQASARTVGSNPPSLPPSLPLPTWWNQKKHKPGKVSPSQLQLCLCLFELPRVFPLSPQCLFELLKLKAFAKLFAPPPNLGNQFF